MMKLTLITACILAASVLIIAAPPDGRGNGNGQGNGNGNGQGNGNGNGQGNGNGNGQGNGNGNGQGNGNGNGQGSGNGQGNGRCLGKSLERMRLHFTEAEIRAVCSRHNTWAHHAAQYEGGSDSVDGGMEWEEAEVRLYSGLKRPHTPMSHTPSYNYPRPRKEYRMLSDNERRTLHRAFNVLKNQKIGNSNYYDLLSDFHQTRVSPGAHWGPAFPGWHREYLLRMERALQAVDSSIMLPYWDSTLDSNLGNQTADSILWSDDFMGPKEGDVTSGPFKNWPMPRPYENRYTLWRGNGSIGRMITDEDVAYIVAKNNFRNITWHVDPYFEMIHGMPHLWVGGPMGSIEAAPFDPIFWTHHGFMDYIWEEQRQRVYRQLGRSGYVYPGQDDDEAFGVQKVQDPFATVPVIIDRASQSHQYPPKRMFPYRGLKNKDSLRELYRNYYYYEPRPTCSASNKKCGSPNLFCVDGKYKCAPKLRPGTDCSDFATSDSCYKGRCINGICVSS